MKSPRLSDEYFIDETLKLARRAQSWTNPNPMVGAVIVKNGKIIARGYHKRVGSHHAEVEALKAAKESVRGATLYVNLEPCSHYGRTPPCVDAVIKAGFKRVVCSTLDPNKKVRGRGIAKLKKAGIAVSVGVREKEARVLNEAFLTFHEKRRPFIALKFAASLDGKMATSTGDSKWITNEKARRFARALRSEYQAILVGINTVIHDDPNLGARQSGKKDPIRIILDSKLDIPLNAQVLRDTNVIIATTEHAQAGKKKLLAKRGITILTFKGKQVPIPKLISALREREIISVFVEGGGKVLGSFVDAKIADKLYAFYAPILVGGEKAVTIQGDGIQKMRDAITFKNFSIKHFEDNFLVIGSLS
ncbi:MAG: bifunctional diaminohydroxyphosphoribosylaminopyrimidine deaminase/5-amino-6-(5-phosphoribosylamino)uracil reductase RibD [Candidatus Pacebacteria bacterium]|nr:bifunctional diaminohydroxyphosphoribosylaminopyrimidine deaminase/5-amino-6-(5-phosphoribosylamino)uracil reductase RibD [Candidatus Paceibacterota bacterium]MDD5356870.1 bifunctional diaminohydroxyphosphoribosylaminopyrimidine deaminase/5-amino-6-(5-phosphoribosylamino)uracil reductase RibD [Candidatus Paceibacterota bacterium]